MNKTKTRNDLLQELEIANKRIIELEQINKNSQEIYEQLCISEERFRKSFHLSADSININRMSDGVYIDINQGFTDITGYTRDMIIGKSSLECNIWVNPDDRKKLVEGLKKDGKILNLKAQFRTREGRIIVGLMSATIISIHDVPCILSITRDITDIVNAEQALIQSEAKYRSVVDNAIEAIVVIQDNVIKLFNPIASKLTGYFDDEFLNMPIDKLVYPDDLPHIAERHQKRLAGEQIESNYSFRILNKKHEIVWVEIKAVLITWEGRPATLNFLNDITEKKRINDALIESENTYRALVEGAGQPIFTVNQDGVFLFMNTDAAFSFHGKPEDFIGKTMWQLFPKEIADLQMQNILTTIDAEKPLLFQSMSVIMGQERWYEARINPLRSNSHLTKAALCIVTDITDRKEVERKILASLKEKEILMKEIHHRVKNNLQIVQSLLSLQENKSKDEALIQTIKSTKNRIRSMALVHERLYKTNDFTDVNFKQYADNVIRELFFSYNTGENIEFASSIDDVHLSVDKAIPCGLILNELVSNSLKHAFPTGANGKLIITFTKKNKEFMLCVEDNGVGMDENKSPKDTLGLTLINVLTQQIKGELTRESNNGTKTTIKFK
ncbi:MAG TPA: PAS domain S-box protein [bacterium]|nr:PAS domain S-box protein [bacterium]HPN44076.1 PAS domain S-box protein [bacterium]